MCPPDDNLPALVVQVTALVDSYMIWVGATTVSAESSSKAMANGALCKDWACAIPSHNVRTENSLGR